MNQSITHLQALVKCVKCVLLDQLKQKYNTSQAHCQDRQMLPTWIEARTIPKKTDKMKHKQKNARKTKGTHVHVARPMPPPSMQRTCHQLFLDAIGGILRIRGVLIVLQFLYQIFNITTTYHIPDIAYVYTILVQGVTS